MGDPTVPSQAGVGVPKPLPDDENPAIIDAKKTYVITVVSAFLYIAVVIVFVLF